MTRKNGPIKGYTSNEIAISSTTFPLESDEGPTIQEFSDFESALESLHANGIDEAFESLVRYFLIPGKETEVESLFASLDFQKQVRFIELLIEVVLKGKAYDHRPSMIEYRKRIAGKLRMSKGKISLNSALLESAKGELDPDVVIAFFQANPNQIRLFLGKLKDNSLSAKLSIVRHMLERLEESSH